jgi:hypothetical protein
MKIHPFRKDNNTAKAATKFVCKECKMVFHTKDSLELHKESRATLAAWYTLENTRSKSDENLIINSLIL